LSLRGGGRKVEAKPHRSHVTKPTLDPWELQGVEFGIVAGIGMLLVVAAAWWTHRRIA
jgi:hypothetical protein